MITLSTACPAARNPLTISATKSRKINPTVPYASAYALAPQQIQSQESNVRHFHASSQRRGHRVHTGNELGEQQRGPPTLIERFRGAPKACFRIDGNPPRK